MTKGAKLPPGLGAILSAIGGFRHTLHLYSSDVSKYAIQAPFLAAVGEDGAVYVTNEDPERVRREFEGLNVELEIVRPG